MEIWVDRAGDGASADDALLGGLIAEARRLGCAVASRDPTLAPTDIFPSLVWQPCDDPVGRAHLLLGGVEDVIGPWMDRQEALARLLRAGRRKFPASEPLRVGELAIDAVGRAAWRCGRPLDLLLREFRLLLFLARRPGRVQPRKLLLRSIWGLGFDPGTNVVQVHVSRLRAKLDRDFAWPMLRTKRGYGYWLASTAEEEEPGMAGATMPGED